MQALCLHEAVERNTLRLLMRVSWNLGGCMLSEAQLSMWPNQCSTNMIGLENFLGARQRDASAHQGFTASSRACCVHCVCVR